MSKPKTSNRDYGYQPNMATSLYDMESTVTTDGMRMAGKVEKHSEFMRPNEADSYEDMEYKYNYPSDVMPPMSPVWPVSPGQNWPDAGEDYTPEAFLCRANYCCCDGDLVGPVKIGCTYPIVEGPWVENPDGTKCDTGKKGTGSNEISVCMNPCGDGNCPPKVWVKIKSPSQSPKGKKKWPGQIKEMQVTMLSSCGAVGDPACPPASACCTGVSFTGTTQMNVGTSQTFTITGAVAGCTYEFRKISGGGTVTGQTYSASASNPGCVNNAVVGLYDRASCKICATLTISITNPAVTGVAYRKRVCGCGGMACASYDYSDNWGCDGAMYPRTGTCLSGWYCGCDPSGTPYSQFHYEPGWSPYPVGDIRTAEMKEQGCCPASPL